MLRWIVMWYSTDHLKQQTCSSHINIFSKHTLRFRVSIMAGHTSSAPPPCVVLVLSLFVQATPLSNNYLASSWSSISE
jgi:hypothetical protein